MNSDAQMTKPSQYSSTTAKLRKSEDEVGSFREAAERYGNSIAGLTEVVATPSILKKRWHAALVAGRLHISVGEEAFIVSSEGIKFEDQKGNPISDMKERTEDCWCIFNGRAFVPITEKAGSYLCVSKQMAQEELDKVKWHQRVNFTTESLKAIKEGSPYLAVMVGHDNHFSNDAFPGEALYVGSGVKMEGSGITARVALSGSLIRKE